MKHAAGILVLSLVLPVLAKSADLMEEATAPAEIARDEARAILVIHSNTNFHIFKGVWDYFVDNKHIGQDKKNSYFITAVEPGEHWIFFSIKDKIMNTGKITFEAGKIYYVLRKAVPGGCIMTTQSPEQFAAYLKEDEPLYLTYKPDDDLPELDEDDIADEKEEFEEEAQEDPEKHADVLDYTGY